MKVPQYVLWSAITLSLIVLMSYMAFHLSVVEKRLAQYEWVFGDYWTVFNGTQEMTAEEIRARNVFASQELPGEPLVIPSDAFK